MKKVSFVIILVVLFFAYSAHAQDITEPSSKANMDTKSFTGDAKTNTTTTTNSGGYDRIEKVIKTEGGTFDNGTKVSTSGNEKDKSFVEGFLNKVSNKVTGVNGSAWATSWTKSWTVGPDGKATEVKETYQKGTLDLSGQNSAKPSSSSSSPSSSSPSSGPSTSGTSPSSPSSGPSVSPGTPTTVATTPPSTGGPSGTPGTPGTPGTKTSGPKAPGTPGTTGKPGIDPAPPKIPDVPPSKLITLILEDQKSNKEQPFPSVEDGMVRRANPIPEDVRARFMLEFGPGINPEDVSVSLIDDSGTFDFPKGEFPSPYYHIFRRPSMDKYYAKIFHTDPATQKVSEKLRVDIPVYAMDARNRTVDYDQKRQSGDKDSSSSHSSPNYGNSGSHHPSSESSPAHFTPHTSSANSGQSSLPQTPESEIPPDLSDIYRNPSESGSDREIGVSNGNSGQANNSSQSGRNDSRRASNSGNRGDSGNSSNSGNSSHGGDYDSSGNRVDSGGDTYTNSEGEEVASENQYGNENELQDGQAMTDSAQDSDETRQRLQRRLASLRGGNSGRGRRGGNGGGGSDSNSTFAFNSNNNQGNSQSKLKGGDNHFYDGSRERTPDTAPANDSGVTTGEVTTLNRNFLVGLSMYAEGGKNPQSFDFSDHPYQSAKFVEKDTVLNFSVDIGETVSQDSVRVIIFDGTEKKEVSFLDISGSVLNHRFSQPTQDAYIWIYGNTSEKPFSYKVMIPVVGM